MQNLDLWSLATLSTFHIVSLGHIDGQHMEKGEHTLIFLLLLCREAMIAMGNFGRFLRTEYSIEVGNKSKHVWRPTTTVHKNLCIACVVMCPQCYQPMCGAQWSSEQWRADNRGPGTTACALQQIEPYHQETGAQSRAVRIGFK